MKVVNTFIICFPFILFIPFLAEAKTADEWFNEGIEFGQAGEHVETIKAYDEGLKVDPQDV